MIRIRPTDLIALAALLFAASASVRAATPYTEEFAANLNGWSTQSTTSAIGWTWTNGTAQARFNALGVPSPQLAILMATSTVSSGSFAGDFAQAGIGVIGFDFMAMNTNPVLLQVEWRSGTNLFYRNLGSSVAATGVWYSFLVPQADRVEGGWSGSGDASLYSSCRTSVTAVSVIIQRRGESAQTYRMDRFFVDRRHGLQSIGFDTNVALGLANLRTNRFYGVESAPDPLSAWGSETSLVALASAVSVGLSPASTNPFFRISTPLVMVPP
jgi:hypothetical protein